MNECDFCGYQNNEDAEDCVECGNRLVRHNPEPGEDGPDTLEEWEGVR